MAPYVLNRAREGYHLGHGQVVDTLIRDGLWDIYQDTHMGKLADQCSIECGFTREQLDDYAVSSYERALAAQKSGFFAREILPIEVKIGRKTKTVTEDEEPARFNEEKLRQLRPAFNPAGVTTAGNASSINDGASAMVVISEKDVEEHGVVPAARVLSYCSSALEPERFTLAPLGAIRHALEIAEFGIDQIDIFEINEAFSLVPLAAMRELGIPREKLNPFGGAVALGHPIGTSGARILVTLLNGLVERQARYGLASLCIGGGEAVAMVVERV
jgi:acetyl-CoA C-acetyltransferase